MPAKSETTPTSIRLTPEAMALWQAVANKMGINKTAVIETMIREKAAALGVRVIQKNDGEDD
jgi:hypothetical protein